MCECGRRTGDRIGPISKVHGCDETTVHGEYVENLAIRKNIPLKALDELVHPDAGNYSGVAKGGSWAPFMANGQLWVCSVNALQLRTNGCAGIKTGLDVLFTATHPNLGAVDITRTGPGGPYGFTLPAAVPGERFGQATNSFVFSNLTDCAYIITLGVTLLPTTGDSAPGTVYDQIGFCKK